MEGNVYYILKLVPLLAGTAALFGFLGWWLRGRLAGKSPVPPQTRPAIPRQPTSRPPEPNPATPHKPLSPAAPVSTPPAHPKQKIKRHRVSQPESPAQSPAQRPAAADQTKEPAESFPLATKLWGREITRDDLTAVLGVSTRIASILRANDLASWEKLAAAEVSQLRTILAAAGPRFAAHDPTDWPRQAKWIVAGKWRKLHKWQEDRRPILAAKLKGSKPDPS